MFKASPCCKADGRCGVAGIEVVLSSLVDCRFESCDKRCIDDVDNERDLVDARLGWSNELLFSDESPFVLDSFSVSSIRRDSCSLSLLSN